MGGKAMTSIWQLNESQRFEPLRRDIHTEALIIGGGMAGILTAFLLKQKGLQPVLIDAGRIGHGVTMGTTAKITAQHNVVYSRLVRQFGLSHAQYYANMSMKAVKMFEDIVQGEGISCDFKSIATCLYSLYDHSALQDEYNIASHLKLPVRLEKRTELPFLVKAALYLDHQAQFNPLAFLSHIVKGLEIYEDTRALSISGNAVATNHGKITAKNIVIATHFPFYNRPGYYFVRMHQDRSYVLALEGAGTLNNAYLGIDGGRYSFRQYGERLLLGGGGHRSGKNQYGGKYAGLEKAAQRFFPQSHIYCRWSAQDCMTHDSIPYIGHFSSATPNIYVATGFNKWGMSNSMVAAMLLSAQLTEGRSNFGIFSPQRQNFFPSLEGTFLDSIESIAGLSKQGLYFPTQKLNQIAPGHGGIVQHQGKKVGAYRAIDGKVFLVSTRCPHLGCQLTWNPDESTWDCPCHGSRFDYTGKWLSSPAQRDLKSSKR